MPDVLRRARSGPQHCSTMTDRPGQPGQPRRRDERPRRRRAHTRSRDLERYADLFARRTKAMRSSAMRDLMAITARPEVISLAGGLPGTPALPSPSFPAQKTPVAHEASAGGLQDGPPQGLGET